MFKLCCVCCHQVLKKHNIDHNDIISREELERAFKDVSCVLHFKQFDFLRHAFPAFLR